MASRKMRAGVAASMQRTGQGARGAASMQRTGQGAKEALVSCMDCVHAQLHRYGENPVLAACKRKPNTHNERFPYQVEVARFLRHCIGYERDLKVKYIEQRSRVA